MKRVSIIIPCFNQGQYLAEAVESVLSQTRPPQEIIIVDDGSIDNTAEVAARFRGVRYFFQKNSGPSAARNTGLRHATGDYTLFLDADDILLPSAIEHCLSAFSSQPGVAFAFGGCRLVDSARRLISEELPQPHADHFEGLLRGGNHIKMHGTVMYDANILKSAGGFDESLRGCEDYELYLRLAKNHPVAVYSQISAEYRKHSNNATHNAPMMARTASIVMARYAATARESPNLRAAYAEGKRYWRGFYGRQIVASLAAEWVGPRRVDKLASLLFAGLRYDRGFILRFVQGFALRITRRFMQAATGRLRRRSTHLL